MTKEERVCVFVCFFDLKEADVAAVLCCFLGLGALPSTNAATANFKPRNRSFEVRDGNRT